MKYLISIFFTQLVYQHRQEINSEALIFFVYTLIALMVISDC